MDALPPWIQAADPAAHMAQGIQMGLSAAAQQAQQQYEAQRMQMEQEKNQFYEQQALKEQQLEANRDARAQAELQLQSSAAARKSEAMLGYQKDLQSGVDPLQAMLKWGPALGQPATSIAAAQRALSAKTMTPPAPKLVDLGGGVQGVQYGNQFHVLPQPKAQWHTEDRTDEEGNPYQVQVNSLTGEEKAAPRLPITGRISQQDRDELRVMEKDREDLKKELANPKSAWAVAAMQDPKTLNQEGKNALAELKRKQQELSDLEGSISDFRQKLRGGIAPKPKQVSAKSKVDRANDLSKQHPEWNKQQVIDAVNQEFANAASQP